MFKSLWAALLGALLIFTTLGQGTWAQAAPPPPSGGQWQVDHTDPPDIMIGPLGKANNYEIKNDGPASVQVYVVKADGTVIEGPVIPKGQTRTVGAEAGGSIKGTATASGGAKGSYKPEP